MVGRTRRLLNCLADPDVQTAIESLYRQYQRHYVGRESAAAAPPPPKAPRVHAVSRRLGPEAVERLIADYIGGMKAADVATRYGISKDAALRLLHQHGVVRPWGTNQHRPP